jgi:hypothetical protein
MTDAPFPAFRLALLGRFELTGPQGIVDLPSRKLAGLLAYLACTAPRPQPREKLSALLWGSHFDAQAKQNLRQALYRLRKMLGHDAIEGDGEVVSLNAAVICCDVGRFEALVHEGSRDALSAAASTGANWSTTSPSAKRAGTNGWPASASGYSSSPSAPWWSSASRSWPPAAPSMLSRPASAPSRSTPCARTPIG